MGVPLDVEAMQAAAQALVGNHDFTTFRSSECQAKSPVKTLDQLDVHRIKDDIRVVAAARSFLHSQVRSMVGALALVGEGEELRVDASGTAELRRAAIVERLGREPRPYTGRARPWCDGSPSIPGA